MAGRAAPAGSGFREGRVEADGFSVRFVEAGNGAPLVHLHGAGGLRLTRAHDLLAEKFRVVAFEMPGFGKGAPNDRTGDLPELAATMAAAAAGLGLDRYNLMGTSFGGSVATHLALAEPARVRALVLEAPATLRPDGTQPPAGPPEEVARRLYAHPERLADLQLPDPEIMAQVAPLLRRLRGPARDAAFEARLRGLDTPTLVLFGTLDAVIPPEMGRCYKQLLPDCHLVFVYDAGHAIAGERPEAFAEVVGDFLERNDAFVVSRTRTVIHP